MIKEINLWKFILNQLEQSDPVILLCVVESAGSSPGRKGFKMAVTSENIFGSIGGGIMEHKFVEMVKVKLDESIDDPLIRKQIHNKVSRKDQSGMICSGEQTILLFQLDKKYSTTVSKIISTLSDNLNGVINISPDHFSFSENINKESNFSFEMKSESEWSYSEVIGYMNHLYIVGGGHCSLAFSRIMKDLDFYIHVFEDREKLNTIENNTFAHEITIVSDYTALNNLIPSGNNNYVVIMTFGYRTDDMALRSLINKDFKYLGVLGSQTKIMQMFDKWREDKLPEEKLKKINSPVGLKINSQTPEEIAISIAAEIIAVKNHN